MKKSYLIILIPISLLALFAFAKKAEAADEHGEHIVINEVYPNPEAGESEWIELYNPTPNEINLSFYTIKDKAGHTFSDLGGITIKPEDYSVVYDDKILNDDGDTIFLLVDGSTIDRVIYDDTLQYAPLPSKGKSISRVPNGSDSDNDASDFQRVQTTKGGSYIEIIYSSDISISEIMPSPGDGVENEYIEIFNSGEGRIDISDWKLEDEKGTTVLYYLPTNSYILPKQYIVFYHPITKISLNDDDGDGVELIDPNGEVKSMILYDEAIRGQSYSKIGENWSWTLSLTPNEPNVLTEAQVLNQAGAQPETISEARAEENGIVVTVRGIVTVLPGVLSSQYFYIQDEVSGIQIYSYYKNFPDLQVGDEIELTGTLSETSGERRIKLDQVPAISLIKKSAPIEPEDLPIEQIDESKEGRYVHISGQVKETSGDTFYVQSRNSDSSVKVIIKESTGINKPKMRRGDSVEISGIVSQYKDEYRILPITQDDVKVITSGDLPLAGPELNYFVLSAIIFMVWNLLAIVKKKLRNLPKRLLYKARVATSMPCKAIWEAAKLFLLRALRPASA